MANVTALLSFYRVTLGRNIEVGSSISYAVINCYGTSDSHQYRYSIYFVRPDSEPLPNTYSERRRRGSSFVPYDLYPMYIDLLRNEKPLSIFMDSDMPEMNRIFSGTEPIGEGEP